jgi:type VI secretion system protein VasD
MRSCLRLVTLACSITLAVGCGSGSRAPILQGAIKTAPTANPDLSGRPSPVVIRTYELRAVGAFDSADFFSLFERESETLGSELVGREEYDLRPGETRPYKRQLQPDTKFFGVVAAFRDLENSRWRQAVPVPAKREVALTVGVEAQAVTLTVK